MDEITTVPTWGRMEGALDCAFDLFRLPIVRWGQRNPGERRSPNPSDGIGIFDRPRTYKLPTRLSSLNITQKWSLLFAPPSKRSGPIFLPSHFVMPSNNRRCRPALPSSALLLRPVYCQRPRSSTPSKSVSQSSSPLRRKRCAHVFLESNVPRRWHPIPSLTLRYL